MFVVELVKLKSVTTSSSRTLWDSIASDAVMTIV